MLPAFATRSNGYTCPRQYNIYTDLRLVYCSEMAPPHLRGRFNQLYQIVLTFFILVAQVINLIINLTNAVSWGWRLSLGFAFVPSLILFLGGVFLPDSPNSLLERGHLEQVSSCNSAGICSECQLTHHLQKVAGGCKACIILQLVIPMQ